MRCLDPHRAPYRTPPAVVLTGTSRYTVDSSGALGAVSVGLRCIATVGAAPEPNAAFESPLMRPSHSRTPGHLFCPGEAAHTAHRFGYRPRSGHPPLCGDP